MKRTKKEKSPSIKHKIREERKKQQRIAIALTATVVIVTISSVLIYSLLNQSTINRTGATSAIIDHLSLTYPNQTFVETATNLLKQAGHTVDYFSGEKVTVEFYRNLPIHEYKLIVLRVHSSATNPDGSEGPVTLFSAERLDPSKYPLEQQAGQLRGVAYTLEDMEKGITYFGITPLFITQCMKGNFNNTTIIMMGCEGLRNTVMAQAFVQKGAKVYIGWTGPVSASHTDAATLALLENLLLDKLTVKQAIINTMNTVGADPLSKSELLCYPLETAEQTIE
ncbi:MAG: hypothetical protein QW279_04820 [Candidatus Jordarchaeaceae archaeon]